MKCVILFIVMFIAGSKAAAAPFITPCLWSDSACILTSAKKAMPYFIEGIKSLDVPPIDPIFIKESIADAGDLKLKIEDLTVAGMSKAELVEITRKDADSTLSLVVDIPVEGRGTYTAGGKLLSIDIEGHGDIMLRTDKVRINIDVKLKKNDKDGKTYYSFDDYEMKYEIIDELEIELDNLFNGDKKKAEPLLAIIRQNSKLLLQEIGKPVIKELVDIEVKTIEKFFNGVPSDELELPA